MLGFEAGPLRRGREGDGGPGAARPTRRGVAKWNAYASIAVQRGNRDEFPHSLLAFLVSLGPPCGLNSLAPGHHPHSFTSSLPPSIHSQSSRNPEELPAHQVSDHEPVGGCCVTRPMPVCLWDAVRVGCGVWPLSRRPTPAMPFFNLFLAGRAPPAVCLRCIPGNEFF